MKRQDGFTLIELMVVVAIIGTLGMMVIPNFATSQEAARTARVQADLRTIESAIVMYQADHGLSPDSISDLTSAKNGYGPYLKSEPVPPAGTVRVTDANVRKTITVASDSVYTITSERAMLAGYSVENIR